MNFFQLWLRHPSDTLSFDGSGTSAVYCLLCMVDCVKRKNKILFSQNDSFNVLLASARLLGPFWIKWTLLIPCSVVEPKVNRTQVYKQCLLTFLVRQPFSKSPLIGHFTNDSEMNGLSFKICHPATNSWHFFKPAMCYQHMQSALLIATCMRWTKVKVVNCHQWTSFWTQNWNFSAAKKIKKCDWEFVQWWQWAGIILVLWRVNSAANATVTRADDICICHTYGHCRWRLIKAFSMWIFTETKTCKHFQWHKKGRLFLQSSGYMQTEHDDSSSTLVQTISLDQLIMLMCPTLWQPFCIPKKAIFLFLFSHSAMLAD